MDLRVAIRNSLWYPSPGLLRGCCPAHQSHITFCTLLEDPGDKVPSAPSSKNRTNLCIAYTDCELC